MLPVMFVGLEVFGMDNETMHAAGGKACMEYSLD